MRVSPTFSPCSGFANLIFPPTLPIISNTYKMLSPNINQTSEAVTSYYQKLQPIWKYVNDLLQLELGTFTIDGTQVPLWDAFPGIHSNLAKAQNTANIWNNNTGNEAQNSLIIFIYSFSDEFTQQTNSILQILESKSSVTPGQRQQIIDSLNKLLNTLQKQSDSLKTVQTDLVSFEDRLSPDLASLSAGENSLSNAIPRLKNAELTEIEKFAGGPMGAGFAKAIEKIMGRLIQVMKETNQTLPDLINENKAASQRMGRHSRHLERYAE